VPRARLGWLNSLRGRLTLSYALVVLVSVTAAAAYSTAVLRGYMLGLIERDLLTEARLVSDDVSFWLARGERDRVAARVARLDPLTEARILVIDMAGQPVAATSDQYPIELPPADPRLAAALAGRTNTSTGVDSATPNERVQATVPVVTGTGQVVGAVRTSLTLEDVEGMVNQVHAATLVGAVAAAALAGTLGLWLAASVARPVREVARSATALAARRSVRRLPEPRSGPDEVRALIKAFNDLADQLATFERARGEFASDVSHELHSLASAMQTASEALQRGAYTSEPALGESLVAGLVGHARRLSRLAEDLLELARMEGGRLSLDVEDVDLRDVVRSVQNEWLAEANRRGITLRTEVPPTALALRADPDRLVQAVGNLVENALKYAGAGGRVDVTVEANGGAVYELAVQDTGPGVPAAARSRVFERYFRLEGRVGAGPGGMGLGLAIAHGIAAAHGGNLSVETPPAGGARFVLRIARTGPPEPGTLAGSDRGRGSEVHG
jgi:two-component system sensor histidine kinase BaeS